MKLNELISIVIPIYNVEKYLDSCIQSIINQTYTNLEIILVDDGSDDNCPAMCDKYALNDSRIKVIHQKNQGVSSARNAGIDESTGTYMMFIDSDDWVDESYVEMLIESIEDNDLVCSNFNTEIESGTFTRNFNMITANEMIKNQERLLIDCVNSKIYTYTIWGKLYHKSIIDNTKFKRFAYSEDAMFCREILRKCSSVKLLTASGYHYRISENGVTADNMRDEEKIDGSLNMLFLTKSLWEAYANNDLCIQLDNIILKNITNYIRIVCKHRIANRERVNKNLQVIKANCYEAMGIIDRLIMLYDCIIYRG